MKRIGVVASKIAKDNYWLYYFYVIVISWMLSFLLFLVVGLVVVFALAVLNYVGVELIGKDFSGRNGSIIVICMVSLTVMIMLFNIVAILRNVRLPVVPDKK